MIMTRVHTFSSFLTSTPSTLGINKKIFKHLYLYILFVILELFKSAFDNYSTANATESTAK